MPGKQKEYFPLNLDMESFYSYEDMSSFMRGLESPPSTPILYNFPPANSEDEDESTSSSVPGSDLDVDEMETLVIDIRDKLRTSSSHTNGCSSSGPSSGVSPGPSSNGSRYLSHHLQFNSSVHHSTTKCSSRTTSSFKNSKCSRWRKNGGSSSSTSSSPSGHCCLNQINHSTIGKHGKAKWRHSKSLCELNTSRVKDTYQLLHELLESGSLIKEAVRRLKKTSGGNGVVMGSNSIFSGNSSSNAVVSTSGANCNSSSNGGGTNGISMASNSTGNNNGSSRKFWFQEEDTENSYVHRSMMD